MGEHLPLGTPGGVARVFLACFLLEALQGDDGFSGGADRYRAVARLLFDAEVVRISRKGFVRISAE